MASLNRLLFLLAFVLFLGSAAVSHAELKAAYQPEGVVVDCLKPGSQVAYLFAEQRPSGWSMHLSTGHGVMMDDDGDGQVLLKRNDIPPQGIVVAIAVETGEVAWSGPEDYRFAERGLGAERFTSSTTHEGAPGSLEWGWQEVVGLWVRPGSQGGTWWLDGVDGSDRDLTGPADNRLSLAFSGAEPADQSAEAPEILASGDRLAVIDLETMSLHLWPGTILFGEPGAESPSLEGGAQ